MAPRWPRYLLIWALLLATVWLGDRAVRSLWLTQVEPRTVTPRGSLASFELLATELFQAASPSVVYIFTRTGASGGAGSGFLWDTAGHVVTNNHVVQGVEHVMVRLDNGEAVPATVVGAAPDYDLAVVRLQDTRASLAPLPIGSSADLQVGQAVFAIGNPFGLTRTLTTGIVSALNRRLPTATGREIPDAIQTDAAINPGNSGGPLLDSAGRLIGVNTAILSQNGGFAGIGFAVPVDVVNRIVPQLVAEGRVPRPGIGVTIAPEEIAARFGAPGLVVARVIARSPAEAAGLTGFDTSAGRVGDVIVAVEGEPVHTIAELARALERAGIGNRIRLTLRRDGRERTVTIEVTDIG